MGRRNKLTPRRPEAVDQRPGLPGYNGEWPRGWGYVAAKLRLEGEDASLDDRVACERWAAAIESGVGDILFDEEIPAHFGPVVHAYLLGARGVVRDARKEAGR